MQYDGTFYAAVGDFLREQYLNYGFTRGTVQEVDFLTDLFALPAGASILDVGCGAGRHSLELARRGYKPYGIDISSGLIDVARQQAQKEGLDAHFEVVDARTFSHPPTFDAAICLCEGAFGLVGSDEDHLQLLINVRQALRPGAKFVLTAINAIDQARRFGAGSNETIDPYTNTVHIRETLRNSQGETREADLYTTAFTYRELALLFRLAGLKVEAGYSGIIGQFARTPLTMDAFEIMMIGYVPHK